VCEAKEREESRGRGILELEVRNKIIWNVVEKNFSKQFRDFLTCFTKKKHDRSYLLYDRFAFVQENVQLLRL